MQSTLSQVIAVTSDIVKKTLLSFPDLELAVVNSDHDIRSATVLKRSRDVKGWLKPNINTPKNHTNPHSFLFSLNERQQCEMKYRNWSSDAWLPGVVLLEVCEYE